MDLKTGQIVRSFGVMIGRFFKLQFENRIHSSRCTFWKQLNRLAEEFGPPTRAKRAITQQNEHPSKRDADFSPREFQNGHEAFNHSNRKHSYCLCSSDVCGSRFFLIFVHRYVQFTRRIFTHYLTIVFIYVFHILIAISYRSIFLK